MLEEATFDESDIDVVVTSWHGLFAPAKTPADVLDKIEAATKKAMKDPKWDEALAKELAGFLEDSSLQVWFDRQMLAGPEWRLGLAEKIHSHEVMVFILTRASAESPECKWEFDKAIDAGKVVIPIMLQETELREWHPGHCKELSDRSTERAYSCCPETRRTRFDRCPHSRLENSWAMDSCTGPA